MRYYLPKTVTVQYVDPEGNLLIQVEQKSVTVGGEYELSYKMTTGGDITVTHVAGVTIDEKGNIVKSSKQYKPTTGTVKGTLEERDLVVRVICTQVGVATVVSVTVSWGTLEYIYDYGDWNAETHSYDISVRPKDYPKNTVTVTSGDESTVPVHVAVKYQAKNGYEAITGYFTYNSTQDEKDKTDGFWLGLQESNKVFLWLDCDVPMDMTGTTVTGQCTVTITAGNTTQENGT